MNNEIEDEYSESRKVNFLNLKGLMLVMFNSDTMIYPKESEWFVQLDQDSLELLDEGKDSFYNNDNIGLRSLNEAGKVEFVRIDGNHLQFSDKWIRRVFIPFLKESEESKDTNTDKVEIETEVHEVVKLIDL